MPASVVIATYNGSRFLRETLESVFAQTMPPGEIIVVDDLSTDDTVEVVQEIARTAPVPLRLIRLEANSGGPTRPMNVGVEAATGDIVCLLDHDDLMAPSKIELHSLALEEESVGLAFGQAAPLKDGVVGAPRLERWSETASHSKPTGHERIRRLDGETAFNLLVRSGYNYGGAGGTSFRKEAWRSLGGFDESYKIVWDYDFALRLARSGLNVAYCEEVAYHHRYHEGNLEFTHGGLQLARETVRLLSTHANSPDLPSALKAQFAKHQASARLGLVWQLRKNRRFGEAFRELGQVLRAGGFSKNCAKEFLKTTIASLTPAFLTATRSTGS